MQNGQRPPQGQGQGHGQGQGQGHGQGRRKRRDRNRRGGGGGQNQQNPQRRQDQPRGPRHEEEPKDPPHVPKRYAIAFFETFMQAKADLENLAVKAKEVDQLNIVIKAEGNQWDVDLNKVGKVFAGEAWHLIHTRRSEEGWYNEPR